MPVLHTQKTETKTIPIPHLFVVSNENLIGAATAPLNPTYDTALTGQFNCGTQTGTGTTTNIFWTLIRLPTGYVNGSNLTLSVDDLYTLAGDAVIVAGGTTIDLEAYLYDSANADFSNADINATAAQAIAATVGTDTFTITGTTLAAGDLVLLRFTSSVQITSAGGAGTGVNGFNNFRYTCTVRV